jgi:hypothetical protein
VALGVRARAASERDQKNVAPRNTPLQHLQRDVIVVVVGVVVDVAIVQVDVGVPRSRRRGRPVIVGLPPRGRIASSLCVVLRCRGRPLPCRTNIVARSHRAASFIRHLASHLLNAPWKTPATFPCQISTWPLLATAVAHRPHEAPTEAGGMLPRSLATLPALMHLLHALKKNSTAARCRGKTTLTPTARPAHAGPHCKCQSSKVKAQKSCSAEHPTTKPATRRKRSRGR